MNQQDVIRKLCVIVSRIGADHYKSELPHDCFCADSPAARFQQVHPDLLTFVENAVNEKIARDRMR
jgi:hypothetical protein